MIVLAVLLALAALLALVVFLNVFARRRPPLTPDEEHEARQW